ncbi:unnamed protein product [Hymenolepis diminuta]|uniref:Uncharacterized protein n=1 Tax=Hymenolepis diminuta TaxID=6216 RepID=A0A564YPG9_HYMDI|nr:unnamed protein product [Hymenolepis diminuta]
MNWPSRGREKSSVNALLTHSLRTSKFVRRVLYVTDENAGKSMNDILLKIFKCLME